MRPESAARYYPIANPSTARRRNEFAGIGNLECLGALAAHHSSKKVRGMRAIFLILIIGVVALIAAIHFGLVDITQTRSAEAPTVAADGGKITATGGQTPKFEVNTGSVGIGSREQNVTVPSVKVAVPVVEVRRPADAKPAPPAQPAQ